MQNTPAGNNTLDLALVHTEHCLVLIVTYCPLIKNKDLPKKKAAKLHKDQ